MGVERVIGQGFQQASQVDGDVVPGRDLVGPDQLTNRSRRVLLILRRESPLTVGRADLRHTEAVGHFHLYNWLCAAVGTRCVISPEFPTGNGKVDLVLRSEEGHVGLIEVKSFTSQAELAAQKAQAARYAASRGLLEATLALFVPSDDEELIQELSRTDAIQIGAAEVRIHTVAVAAQ